MIEIHKAYTEDFEILYPVLKELDAAIPKETWRQLFVRHWDSHENYVGLKLVIDNKIAGFLGLIFSERIINGNIEKICNWSSLIALKEYRDGVTPKQLILKALEVEDCTIAGLTPTDKLYKIYMGLGFKELDNGIRLLFRLGFNCRKYKKNIYYNDSVAQYLNEKDLKIFNDHKKFNCSHILVKTEKGCIYILLRKCRYPLNKLNLPRVIFYANILIKKILGYSFLSSRPSFGKVHYCNDFESLSLHINKHINDICKRTEIKGLLIDERFLNHRKIKNSIKGSWQKSVYKSNSKNPILPADIDSLYSELFLLDL